MLFSNFLLLFPFPPNIFIFIFSLIKAAQKVIENTEKFITLTGGRILTEKFTNSIKLKNEWKWVVGKASFNIRILLKSTVRKAFYVCLLLVLTRAFMSTNRSSSSARRTDAVPLNSFITGRYLKRKKNEVKKYRPAPEAEESRSFLTYLHWQGFAYGKIPLPGQLLSCRFVALPYLSPTLSCYKRRKTWHSAWKLL